MTPSHLKCHDAQEDKDRERSAQDSGTERNRVGLGTQGMAGGSDRRLAVACSRKQHNGTAVLVFVPSLSLPAVPPPPKLTHRQPFSLSLSRLRVLLLLAASDAGAADAALTQSL